MKLSLLILAALSLMPLREAIAKTVRYELVATKGTVNLSGKKDVSFALMLNGQIPAPLLEFTEGDEAEIVLKNAVSDEELSVHWHGILLPPEMDGVPYVNTPPIRPGESFTFRFPIRQTGTYWYHSHTNVQEQKGLYGPIRILPRNKTVSHDRDLVLVVSDWSDEDATTILRNLRKDGDYYLYKKKTVRSLLGALQAGKLSNYLGNEWTRMGAMDLSDVGYDAFLINGKREIEFSEVKPGERLRLRVINASASTCFYLSLGRTPMQLISADGQDVQPALAQEVLIGMAETYDFALTVPQGQSLEFRATAQDGTGKTSAWIGKGKRVSAPDRVAPDLYSSMEHTSADHEHSAPASADPHRGHGHSVHSHPGHKADPRLTEVPPISTLTVNDLRSRVRTSYPPQASIHDVKLVLNGDMDRYIWHINGRAIHQDRTIEIHEGDVIRFTFENRTMMHHPMHLHGHFFRVLNAGRDHSPLKHTVDVPPHSTRTIEFLANERGEWMLHCHNLYHLKTGMARVVKYSAYSPAPSIARWQKQDPHLHDHVYFRGEAEVATNHAQGGVRWARTWDELEARFEGRRADGGNTFTFDSPWEFEGDLFYRKWFGRFFTLTGGYTRFAERDLATAGVTYLLPFRVGAEALVDHRGRFRLGIEKRIQWASTLFSDLDVTWRPSQGRERSEDLEYEATLMYGPRWSWAAGLMLTENGPGAGLQVRF